jgi:hypothetical protein
MSTSSPPTVNLNESRAGKVATVIILCPALAFVTVMLRLYTRFVLEKKRFLEDYFIALAMVGADYPRDKLRSSKVFTLFIALFNGSGRVYGYL